MTRPAQDLALGAVDTGPPTPAAPGSEYPGQAGGRDPAEWWPLVWLCGRESCRRFTYHDTVCAPGMPPVHRYRLKANGRWLLLSAEAVPGSGRAGEDLRCWQWAADRGAFAELPQAVAVWRLAD